MLHVSVTRLRLRGLRHFPGFFLWTQRSIKSATATPGFVGGDLGYERGLAFWTVTVWKDIAAMRAFRNAPAHLESMRRLGDWCSEASYGRFEIDAAGVPSWEEAHRQLVATGKASKVKHPSALHLSGRVAGDAWPKGGRKLEPR